MSFSILLAVLVVGVCQGGGGSSHDVIDRLINFCIHHIHIHIMSLRSLLRALLNLLQVAMLDETDVKVGLAVSQMLKRIRFFHHLRRVISPRIKQRSIVIWVFGSFRWETVGGARPAIDLPPMHRLTIYNLGCCRRRFGLHLIEVVLTYSELVILVLNFVVWYIVIRLWIMI